MEFPLLLTAAKVNVDFANCAAKPPKMFLNVLLIALLVFKAVLILVKLEKLNVLLAAFTLAFKKSLQTKKINQKFTF